MIEARVAKAPLIPFKELTKTLKNANTIVLLFSAALFPMWILSSLYLQQVLGLSPLAHRADLPADDARRSWSWPAAPGGS